MKNMKKDTEPKEKKADAKKRKVLKGVVVSDKMNKTRTVLVKRLVQHPKYKKFITMHKKYKVHDEENATKTGDVVEIESTRPISKDKHFKIVKV